MDVSGSKNVCNEEQDDESNQSEIENEEPAKKRKLRAHSIEDKIDVLEFARRNSIHEASKHYKVDRKSIRDWKLKEKSMREY